MHVHTLTELASLNQIVQCNYRTLNTGLEDAHKISHTHQISMLCLSSTLCCSVFWTDRDNCPLIQSCGHWNGCCAGSSSYNSLFSTEFNPLFDEPRGPSVTMVHYLFIDWNTLKAHRALQRGWVTVFYNTQSKKKKMKYKKKRKKRKEQQ